MDDATLQLLGKRFIERRDVKAVQDPNGAYHPERSPFKLTDLRAHVEGDKTYGYYVVSRDNNCRVITLDIDLTHPKKLVDGEHIDDPLTWENDEGKPTAFIPRTAWLEPGHWAIPTLTAQLNLVAEGFARRLHRLFDVPVAAAYSGHKGVHVYGFTGSIPAADAREAALAILEGFGFEPSRGSNFFQHEAHEAIEVEVFPKQTSLDGKDLGNLVRLPLGINRKTGKAGHFIRFGPPPTEFKVMAPQTALNGELPWL